MEILIIGNSAAGIAAVEAIRKYDQQSSIIQLSDEQHPIYSRCLLSYYLSGSISKKALQYRDEDFHRRMHVQLHPGKRAVELDTNAQKVICDDGSVFSFDTLLIATGSSAKYPDNIPKGIEGICVLRTIDDVDRIRNKVRETKCAVVLGGGLVGVKAASALRECGLDTKVIIRSNRVLSQMIDHEASEIITKHLIESNIEILLETDVVEIQSQNNKLVSLTTDHGRTIPCELLIAAKGVQANTALVHGGGIKRRSGIETDQFLQTSQENIFAAGDVAETFDITTGEYANNALWTCAVQQGQLAGLNMIGRKKAYDGSLGMNSLNVVGIPLISYGTTSPRNRDEYQFLVLDRREKNIYKKVVLKNHQIKGIILHGAIDNAGVLLSLIRKKTDVSTYEDELLSDQFNFGKMLKYDGRAALEIYQNT